MKGSFRKCWKKLILNYGHDGRCRQSIVIMEGDDEYNLIQTDRLRNMQDLDCEQNLRVVLNATYSEVREIMKAWQYDLLKEDQDADVKTDI